MYTPEPQWLEETFELGEAPPPTEEDLPYGGDVGVEMPETPPIDLVRLAREDEGGVGEVTGWDSEPQGDNGASGMAALDPSLLDLNAEQLEAVEAGGVVILEAPPGSGKTRTLAGRVCRILQKASPQSILAVTFTRNATAEMRQAIRRVVGDVADDVVVTTLHSLGLAIVSAEHESVKLGKNPGVAAPYYAGRLLKKAMKLAGIDERWDAEEMARVIAKAKARLQDPEDYETFADDYYSQNVARVYKQYQQLLRDKNLLDFGDMLRLAVKALGSKAEARGWYQQMYRHILVDEWQDINLAQYRLLRMLIGPETDVFVVGDPLQSIYGWRGADPGIFERLERDYPSAKRLRLRVNYRNTETISRAAESIVRGLGLPERDIVTEGGRGEPITLVRCDTDWDEALRVADEVARLASAEEAHHNECAVLVRTGRQARLIEQAMLQRGVPYALVGQKSFFEIRVVREVLAWLRLALDPFDHGALETALNAPPRGLGTVTRDKLRRGALGLTMETLLAVPGWEDLPGKARQAVADFLGMVDDVQKVRSRPPAELMDYILRRTGYAAWLEKMQDGNGNGNGLIDGVMADFAGDSALHHLRRMLEAHEDSGLESFLADVEAMQAQPDEMNGVFIGTIHAAKGLEWPVVLLPGLDEGVLPHVKSLLDEERLREEHHLFYVALTRAMRQVYVLGARYRAGQHGHMREYQPSRFLRFLPTDRVRRV
jgi:DNA helicase-2/ATP-dependent DNA helicase PcrA